MHSVVCHKSFVAIEVMDWRAKMWNVPSSQPVSLGSTSIPIDKIVGGLQKNPPFSTYLHFMHASNASWSVRPSDCLSVCECSWCFRNALIKFFTQEWTTDPKKERWHDSCLWRLPQFRGSARHRWQRERSATGWHDGHYFCIWRPKITQKQHNNLVSIYG